MMNMKLVKRCNETMLLFTQNITPRSTYLPVPQISVEGNGGGREISPLNFEGLNLEIYSPTSKTNDVPE